MIFQLTKEDIERSSTMDESDIGKWCFLVQGCYYGFCNTREEAEKIYNAVFNERRQDGKSRLF